MPEAAACIPSQNHVLQTQILVLVNKENGTNVCCPESSLNIDPNLEGEGKESCVVELPGFLKGVDLNVRDFE